MKQRTVRIFITLAVVLSWLTGATVHAAAIEKGVSRALATERAAHVSDIHYSLTFTVPEAPLSVPLRPAFGENGGEPLEKQPSYDLSGRRIHAPKGLYVKGNKVFWSPK